MAGKIVGNGVVSPRKKPGEVVVNAANDPVLQGRISVHMAVKTPISDGFGAETLNPKGERPNTRRASEKKEPVELPLDPELTRGIGLRKIGAGLANLGNTCFLNSVLQCLTYTEPLAAYLQSGRHKTACRASGFCAMCAIQNHVMNALGSSGKILEPSHLVKNLRCISRSFRASRQEDAHEYMVNLMESMHRCCLPSGVASESPTAYEKSLVHKIFGGRLRSQVKCTRCSYGSNTFDPFLDLSLQIVRADSLLKALSHFTAVEQLDGGEKVYQCERCKVKVRALKQLTVDKAPYILAIHLKRFNPGGLGGKIDKKVEFERTLDMKPFVSGSHEGDLKYTLYGVLVHAGWSTHSGHYYCFIRTSSGIWHALDDNRVYQVSEKSVLEQKAYMLFYVRDRGTVRQPIVKTQPQHGVTKDAKVVPLSLPSDNECQSHASAPALSHSSSLNSNNAAVTKGNDDTRRKQGNLSNWDSTLGSAGNGCNTRLPSSAGEQPVCIENSSKFPFRRNSYAVGNAGIDEQTTASNVHQVGVCTGSNVVTDHADDHECKTVKPLVKGFADDECKTSKHLVTGDTNNGHKSAIHLGNGVSDNGHKIGKLSLNKDIICADVNGHQAAKHLTNDEVHNHAAGNGLQAAKHLTNDDRESFAAGNGDGCMASHAIGVEHHAANSSSSENGSVISQKDESGNALLCEENGVKGSFKRIEPCGPLIPTKDPSCVPASKMHMQGRNNHPHGKNVKLRKHLGYPQLSRTMPLARRFLLLKAISISKKQISFKRKKHVHLKIRKNKSKRKKTKLNSLSQSNSLNIFKSKKRSLREQYAGNFKKRKASHLGEKESSINQTNDLSKGKCSVNSCQHDSNCELRTLPVQNKSGAVKVEQTNFEYHLHLGSTKSSREICTQNVVCRTGEMKENIDELFFRNGVVRSDNLGSKCDVKYDPGLCSGTNEKESSTSRHTVQNWDASPVSFRLRKQRKVFSNYLNGVSPNVGEACEQDRARFTQNDVASLLENQLQGATVSVWSGMKDDGIEIDGIRDDKKASVGHVLDEWDEEYDHGKRKKVKTSQSINGMVDDDKRHSNCRNNCFQAIVSSEVKIQDSRGKNTATRNKPARI